MLIKNLNSSNKIIDISLPLTEPSGKIRVKQRSAIFDYGQPFASRQNPFNQKNYIEWQIGYDNKKKSFYELSEYLYYFYRWGIFKEQELKYLKKFIENLSEKDLLDKHEHFQINRTHPQPENINRMDFYKLTIKYPQLIYKFKPYDIITEITVREKQRAIGVQPMLYFCFPMTELKSTGEPFFGRTAEPKECADFEWNQSNAFIILKMVKIFGMLSPSHQADMVAILDTVLN